MRVYLALVLATLSFAAPAVAQTDAPKAPGTQEGPVETFDFKDLHINGGRVVPKTIRFEGRAAIKHAKLLELKKDFLPLLHATAKDAVFR